MWAFKTLRQFEFSIYKWGKLTWVYKFQDINWLHWCYMILLSLIDAEIPVWVSTPNSLVVSTDVGLATAKVSWVVPNVTDNSGDFTITASHDSYSTFGIGITNVTFKAIDGSKNKAFYSFTVTVKGQFYFCSVKIQASYIINHAFILVGVKCDLISGKRYTSCENTAQYVINCGTFLIVINVFICYFFFVCFGL